MKVLLINGSPRRSGNTRRALDEVAAALEAEGIRTEIVSIGAGPVQGCTGCNKCDELGRCVFKDNLYETVREQVAQADGLILGSPTYYAGPNGALCALLDRVFYSCGPLLRYKPGSAVAVCRRGGASAALDRLNKYFAITDMPLVPSQYWNLVYGWQPGEVEQDAEGLQTLRTLGRNMAWMLKNLKPGTTPPPAAEERLATNFIR
jgi:multimeric flavodoxin WrbA